MVDPFTATVFGLGIGDVLSMVLFLFSERSGRKSAQDILRELKEGTVIRDYLEWLRRQDQQKLVTAIDTNKDTLLNEIGTLGSELYGLSDAIRREVQAGHRDLADRLVELNKHFLPPVLSPVPLGRRPLASVPMMGRDEELARLHKCVEDAVISGQPGCGKTYLLYHYGKQVGGQFLLTDNPDTAAKIVLSGCPPVVFIDDAAEKADLIRRLLHVRKEYGLQFRLVVVCWPFESDGLIAATGLPRANVIELPLLGRQVIADLVKSVVKDAGYIAPNPVVYEINNQAAGRPGLAVDLTLASLQDDIQKVMRGDTLAQRIGQFCMQAAGPKAIPILAAFAVGGKAGVHMQTIADALGISILDIHGATKNLAPGGVIEEMSKSHLAVIPAALRRALLKNTFFSPGAITLPLPTYESLLGHCPNRDDALVTLLDAVAAGASADAFWLTRVVEQSKSSKVWESYAWAGPRQCEYVFKEKPDMAPSIIAPALHHVPDRAIGWLLDQAVSDKRPLHSFADAPMRQLDDWVAAGKPGSPEAVQRRMTLFNAGEAWLKAGGDLTTAIRALTRCLTFSYGSTESDPGDGMKITIFSGLLTPPELEKVFALWPRLVEILKKSGVPDWKPITSVISMWLRPYNRFGKDPGAEYMAHTKPRAKQMIEDILRLCGDHNGLLRWAYMHADEAGLDPKTVPVSDEYMALFPVERLRTDWEKEETEAAAAAKRVVDDWQKLPFDEITDRLRRYESESASMESSWPRLTPNVCRCLAKNVQPTAAQVLRMMDVGLPSDLVEPFVVQALGKGPEADTLMRRCLADDKYQHLAVFYTLTGQAAHMYDEVAPLLPKHTQMIEHTYYREAAPEPIVRKLLNHDDPAVRLAAALSEFRSGPKHQVRERLKEAWRHAIVEGVVVQKESHQLRHIYDLNELVAYDRTLAYDILSGMLGQGESVMSLWDLDPLAPLVGALNQAERSKLLDKCEPLLVSDLVGALVGEDLALYKQLLANPKLKHQHLKPLIGDPSSPGWTDKALLALQAGYSAERVAHGVMASSWGWSGKESNVWQKWIDAFKPLLIHADPRIQEVGRAGVEWATAAREQAIQREKYREIHGRFIE